VAHKKLKQILRGNYHIKSFIETKMSSFKRTAQFAYVHANIKIKKT